MQKLPAERIGWLDSARGIAFLMVIYNHLDYCDLSVLRFFKPVFLTTFFFVSGYLFKTDSTFLKTLESRLRTLFIPFLIYGTLMLALKQVFSFNGAAPSFVDSLVGMLTQNRADGSFWFIPSLFLFSLFFYWVAKPCKSGKAFLLLATLLFVVNWAAKKAGLPHLNYRIDTMGFACGYMSLGQAFRYYESTITKWMTPKIVLPTFIVYVALVILEPVITGKPGPRLINYMGSPYLIDALVITCLGIFLMVYVSRFAARSRFITFIGSNSLLYFCLHGKAYSLVQFLVQKVAGDSLVTNSVAFTAAGFLITLTSALLLIIPVLAINKWLPFTTGKGYKLWG